MSLIYSNLSSKTATIRTFPFYPSFIAVCVFFLLTWRQRSLWNRSPMIGKKSSLLKWTPIQRLRARIHWFIFSCRWGGFVSCEVWLSHLIVGSCLYFLLQSLGGPNTNLSSIRSHLYFKWNRRYFWTHHSCCLSFTRWCKKPFLIAARHHLDCQLLFPKDYCLSLTRFPS